VELLEGLGVSPRWEHWRQDRLGPGERNDDVTADQRANLKRLERGSGCTGARSG